MDSIKVSNTNALSSTVYRTLELCPRCIFWTVLSWDSQFMSGILPQSGDNTKDPKRLNRLNPRESSLAPSPLLPQAHQFGGVKDGPTQRVKPVEKEVDVGDVREWPADGFDVIRTLLMGLFGKAKWKNKNKQRKIKFWTKQPKPTKIK